MLRESVRNDRNKKRGKEKETKDQNGAAAVLAEELSCSAETENLLQQVSKFHLQTFPDLNNLEKYNPGDPPKNGHGPTDTKLWEQFAELSTKSIVKIVEFAKGIPGFQDFTIADQITLLKSACLEILFLRLCSRYIPETETMTFSNGLTLNSDQLRICGCGPLTDQMFSFAQSFHPLEADSTEVGLLSAICLICADRPDLEEPDKVEALQDSLVDGLRYYARKRRPENTHIFPKLLMKLSDLRSISLKGSSRVQDVKSEIPAGAMPPLMNEMLIEDQE